MKTQPGTSGIITGQLLIAATGTAVRLPQGLGRLSNGVAIKANASNSAVITIGGASSLTNTASGSGNGFVLAPNDSINIPIDTLNNLWVNGTANDWITWLAN